MTKKRKHGIIFLAAGLAAVVVSAVMWYTNAVLPDNRAAAGSAKLLAKAESEIISETKQQQSSAASGSKKTDAKEKALFELPNESGLTGILKVPKLGLQLPVQTSYSQEALKTAPCRYTGEKGELSRFIICGHNYSRHFGSLQTLQKGDEVSFTNMRGTKYSYKVTEVFKIAKDDFTPLKTGSWDLTLFTCNITGLERVTVRCSLVK